MWQIHTQRMVHIHTQAIGTLTHRQLMAHTVYWYTHTADGTHTHTADGTHTHTGYWYTHTQTADGTHSLLVHSHTDYWYTHTQTQLMVHIHTQAIGTLTHRQLMVHPDYWYTHTHTHRWLDLNSHTPITAWTSSKHSLQSTLCARVHRLLVHSHSWHTYTHTYSWYTHTHTAGKVTQQWYKATLLANYSDSTGTQAVQKGWRQHWHTGCVERTKTALAHRLFRKDTDKPEVCVSTGTQAV